MGWDQVLGSDAEHAVPILWFCTFFSNFFSPPPSHLFCLQMSVQSSSKPTLNLHQPSSTLGPLRGRRAPAHGGQTLHPPKGPKVWASGILPQKWQGRISSSIRPLHQVSKISDSADPEGQICCLSSSTGFQHRLSMGLSLPYDGKTHVDALQVPKCT